MPEILIQPVSPPDGKVCIVNCQYLKIYPADRKCRIGEKKFHGGDIISLDGTSGEIYEGKVKVISEIPMKLLEIVQAWKQEVSTSERGNHKRDGENHETKNKLNQFRLNHSQK